MRYKDYPPLQQLDFQIDGLQGILEALFLSIKDDPNTELVGAIVGLQIYAEAMDATIQEMVKGGAA